MAKRMTKEQREWCREYKRQTMFEPMMDDFRAGNETFLTCAKISIRWFEDWASDAHLNIGRNVPGENS